jgi:hypothetical protein
MRREGELSSAAIDRGWPHQVVLPARLCERDGYNEIHEFCRDLTLCSRGHATANGSTFIALRSRRTRKKFMERFDGEKFSPIERGRGANWARWTRR